MRTIFTANEREQMNTERKALTQAALNAHKEDTAANLENFFDTLTDPEAVEDQIDLLFNSSGRAVQLLAYEAAGNFNPQMSMTLLMGRIFTLTGVETTKLYRVLNTNQQNVLNAAITRAIETERQRMLAETTAKN